MTDLPSPRACFAFDRKANLQGILRASNPGMFAKGEWAVPVPIILALLGLITALVSVPILP